MTCDELRLDAQLMCGLKISDVTSLRWVNEATENIVRNHPLAAPKKIVTVTVADGGTYHIAEELIRLESVSEGNSVVSSMRYSCDEQGNMIFRDAGTYLVAYRYMPAMPTNKTANVVIPEVYAAPIQFFIAAKIRGRVFGQNDGDASSYKMQFDMALSNADNTMSRTNRRHRTIPVRY